MSKRPHVESRHERRVERQIQKERRERDRQMKTAGRGKGHARAPEPHILSRDVGAPDEMPPAVAAWIEEETAAQMGHYRRISREQERLEPQRLRWAKEFFARITGPRGFSVHAGTRRTIPKGEIPKRPRRPWRVVW